MAAAERSEGPIQGYSDLSVGSQVYAGLEELRAAGKQPTVRVDPCLGCGGHPHGSESAYVKCLERRVRELGAK